MSTDVGVRKAGGCTFHEELVKKLKPKDTVITFNYDCVLDHALRKHAVGQWSTRYGYTLPSEYSLVGAENWDADPPATASTRSIHLLKLHGSLNWQLPEDQRSREIKIKQRLHGQNGIPNFTAIPPVWNKTARDQPIFLNLWRNAERAIRLAKHVAVVGFSFTPTDLYVQSLFRVALARSNLRTLVIANPSATHRRHVRNVFQTALKGNVVVRPVRHFQTVRWRVP
jgi:hypothetical protein